MAYIFNFKLEIQFNTYVPVRILRINIPNSTRLQHLPIYNKQNLTQIVLNISYDKSMIRKYSNVAYSNSMVCLKGNLTVFHYNTSLVEFCWNLLSNILT